MQNQGKSGGAKKIGRNKRHPCHVFYTLNNRRLKNKLKRIRQSNGEAAVARYLAEKRV